MIYITTEERCKLVGNMHKILYICKPKFKKMIELNIDFGLTLEEVNLYGNQDRK